jgi:hypothetical protein
VCGGCCSHSLSLKLSAPEHRCALFLLCLVRRSGLIRDYYAARVTLVMQQALKDAAAGKSLDNGAVTQIKAEHAYNWTTATNPYPTEVVGDYVEVSKAMRSKYGHFFTSCN